MVSVGIKCWPISDKKSSKLRTARDGELQDTSGAVSGPSTVPHAPLSIIVGASTKKCEFAHDS